MQRTFDTSTAWPQPGRRSEDFEAPDPPEIDVQPDAGKVMVRERDELVEYELALIEHNGTAPGCRWVERVRDRRGRTVETAVSTAEVMAVLRDVGREDDAARITITRARWFESIGTYHARRTAARLRVEVAAGRNLERLSLRPVQTLLARRLAAGESLSEICLRGGFVCRREGGLRPDLSWFERRAGLRPEPCSRTGKCRLSRTASYRVFCQLARALGVEPHELGV